MPKMRWMSSMDREEESSSPSVMDSAARICHRTTRQTGGPKDEGGGSMWMGHSVVWRVCKSWLG